MKEGLGKMSPSPENFWKFILETVQSGVLLKRKSIFSQWLIQEIDGREPDFDPSQIVLWSILMSPKGCWGEAPATNDFDAYYKIVLFRGGMYVLMVKI